MHDSQHVTNQFDAQIQVRGLLTNLRKMLAAKFFNSSYDEDQEAPWSQNSTVYKHSNFFKRNIWTRANFVSGHNLPEHNFASHL